VTRPLRREPSGLSRRSLSRRCGDTARMITTPPTIGPRPDGGRHALPPSVRTVRASRARPLAHVSGRQGCARRRDAVAQASPRSGGYHGLWTCVVRRVRARGMGLMAPCPARALRAVRRSGAFTPLDDARPLPHCASDIHAMSHIEPWDNLWVKWGWMWINVRHPSSCDEKLALCGQCAGGTWSGRSMIGNNGEVASPSRTIIVEARMSRWPAHPAPCAHPPRWGRTTRRTATMSRTVRATYAPTRAAARIRMVRAGTEAWTSGVRRVARGPVRMRGSLLRTTVPTR